MIYQIREVAIHGRAHARRPLRAADLGLESNRAPEDTDATGRAGVRSGADSRQGCPSIRLSAETEPGRVCLRPPSVESRPHGPATKVYSRLAQEGPGWACSRDRLRSSPAPAAGSAVETAKLLAAEGAQVRGHGASEGAAGRRSSPRSARLAGEPRPGAVDIENREAAIGLVQWTVDTFGRVDVLVNNAGYSSRARSIRWVPKDEWDGVINVNLNAVYTLTQAVLPGMIERGGGTIVTVSSAAALRPGLIGGAPYGAAKAGVREPHGPRPQRPARQRHQGHHDHAGRGRHADPVAAPAGARRQGAGDDDASQRTWRGRCSSARPCRRGP